MHVSEKLVQLGFSKNQAAVYSALIELGQRKAGDIIKKTTLHRNIVYEALDDLVLKKLAFKTSKGGVAFFQLSDASTLIKDAEYQLASAKDVAQEINVLRQKSTHEIKLYEGLDGLRAHHEAVISDLDPTKGNSGEFLVLGTLVQQTKELYGQFWSKQDAKRAKMNIPARLLFAPKNEEYAKHINEKTKDQAKLLPPSFKNPSSIQIWKDHTAILLQDAAPFVISIQNQHLAASFREYFETLWNQNVFVTTGLEETKKLFTRKLDEMHPGDEVIFMWANYGEETQEELVPFFNQYHIEREKKNVSAKLLGFERNRKNHEKNIRGNYELRFVSEDINSPLEVSIYPDSITLVYWGEDDSIAIDIQDKNIRDAMKLYFDSLWNQDVKIYRGKEAIMNLMEQSLNYIDNWFIGGNGGLERALPEYWKEYNTRRIKKGIWWHDLVDANTYLSGVQQLPPGIRDEERKYEFKWLPEEVSSPSVMLMFGNTVANILWDAQPEPIAFVIENEEIFAAYQKYFEYLWNQNTFVTPGLARVQKLYRDKLAALKEGESYHVLWANYGTGVQEDVFAFFQDYHKQRVQRNITVQLLGFEKDRKWLEAEMKAGGDTDLAISKIRYLPNDVGSPLQIMIYPDSVVLAHWSKDAVAIDIQRKDIRDAMLLYFHSMWGAAKK